MQQTFRLALSVLAASVASAAAFFATQSVSAYSSSECGDLYGSYAYSNDYGNCTCRDGYVFGFKTLYYGDNPVRLKRCIPYADYCESALGPQGAYNRDRNACQCDAGYILGRGANGDQACIKGPDYCRAQYGKNSAYNTQTSGCYCVNSEMRPSSLGSGYVCMSCDQMYGPNSWYNSRTASCECRAGYALSPDGARCMLRPSDNSETPRAASAALYARVDLMINKYLYGIAQRPKYEQILILTELINKINARIAGTDSSLKREIYVHVRNLLEQRINSIRPR